MDKAKYFPQDIEKKWQQAWREAGLYKFDIKSDKTKYYTLVELPYPSGDLHIGHWFTFVAPDVLSRFKKMQGYNVFFPMGYDAFGLPAENAAIKRGVHPQDWTEKNIATMTAQFETMGTMIDWDHVTITCKPEYYKWNQWIFEKMYEKGLAYRGKTLSNWCPTDQTVLANEHVENGKCWRCGDTVVQKEVEQWFLKITDYAEKLLWNENNIDDPSTSLRAIDWPKSVMVAQNDWIGKKDGVKIKHKVIGMDLEFESFSAYPAWSWADSFIVIAPEHGIVEKLVKGTDNEKEVMDFVKKMGEQTELERKETTEKLGVFTGRYAKDPFGGPDMPIWLANFALMNFGTGIIRCSGHDPRDVEFANKYGIEIREVIEREDPDKFVNAHDGKGILKNSGPFTGREVTDVREEVIEWIEKQGIGTRFVNYHLHDWSVSRQRYWGTPVPMIHCDKCGVVPVPEKDLPVTLPYDVDYQPKGKAPLASNEEWIKVRCPKCGGEARRDPETLDTFFDSSWYYYRYVDPHYKNGPFEKDRVDKLMPVDIYFGGGEHTLGHTLYARFFTKFFHDLKMVDFDEFAKKRVQHGIVLGPDGNKMSKSKGNVINPDDVVKEFGVDAVRVYLAFMMPYTATGPWSTTTMYGSFRFLKRVWDLQYAIGDGQESSEDLYQMHKTIKKVTKDIEENSLNTAVAALMEWLNYLEEKVNKNTGVLTESEFQTFLLLLSPFAPHITEELWQLDRLSASRDEDAEFRSIHQEKWPVYDEKLTVSSEAIIAVQVNGKLRDTLKISLGKAGDQKAVEEIARQSEKVNKHLDGKSAKKIIYVTGKILNFVVG